VDGGFQYRMAYLEPRLIRDALGSRASALPFVQSAVTDHPRLKNAVVPLLFDLSRPLEPLEADQAVATIADALLALDGYASKGRREPTRCAVAVERVRSFLDANNERVVQSSELEAIVDLDRYEIARQFRRCLGTSPYRYLTMRRLGRVRKLIRSGAALAEAALEAGFADQSHMTRQFKQAFGMSPGRWREMQQPARAAA